jgi:hypothetical protein
VYAEAHPRRIAAHGDSPISLKSFNSFISNSFRTLSRHTRSPNPLPSIVCGLFPSQWGCIPPSQAELCYDKNSLYSRSVPRCLCGNPSHGLPLLQSVLFSRRPSHFPSTVYKMLLPQLLCFDNHPVSWGVYPPGSISSTAPRSSSLPATTFCLVTSFLLQSPPQGDFKHVSQ